MRIRFVALMALTLLVAGCGLRTTLDNGPGLSGLYVVNGVDPVGTEYSGTVTIDPAEPAGHYTIQWIITGAILEGSGILDGDRFAVSWQSVVTPRGETRGTAEYSLTDEGHLVGTVTVDGFDGLGTEEIFPEP